MPESIQPKLYRRGVKKYPWLGISLSVFFFAFSLWLVFTQEPGYWALETAVLILIWLAFSILGAWVLGRKKWGILSATTLVVLLIMSRFNVLDWATLGLLLIIVGLISLLN